MTLTPIQQEQQSLLFANLQKLMTYKWGRQLAYMLMFDYCENGRETFDLSVKDGLCAALHQARKAGVQAPGLALMKDLQSVDREAYTLMLQEEILRRTALLELEPTEGTEE